MGYLELALLTYFVYWCIAIFFSQGKYISPSVIYFTSFLAMLILATIFQDYFRLHIEYRTFRLMSIAGFLFLASELSYCMLAHLHQMGRYFCIKRSIRWCPKLKKNGKCNLEQRKAIYIQPVITLAIIIYMFLFFSLAIIFVYINSPTDNWHERMSLIRDAMNLRPGTLKLRFIISQVSKIASALAYVCSYIMIYNIINCGLTVRSQMKFILPDILFAVSTTIFGGGRQAAVELVLYIIILIILFILTQGRKIQLWKVTAIAFPLILCFFFAFAASASFVGRKQDTSNPLLYVARYFCGGLHFLNSFIDNPAISQFWGQFSFSNVYSKLAAFKLVPASAVSVYHRFGQYGNTVTIYGRWYEDFGATGVYIMVCFVSVFFSWLFYSKVLKKRKKENDLSKVLYAKLIISLVWAGYDDRICSLISFGTLVTVFLITVIYWFLIGFNHDRFLNRYRIEN